jgi:NADH-quinone oxidoreductase subunit F
LPIFDCQLPIKRRAIRHTAFSIANRKSAMGDPDRRVSGSARRFFNRQSKIVNRQSLGETKVDIHVTVDEPTREEREAVDSVLGKAETGWSGGERHIELEGRFAVGGHTDRARRHLLLPVLHVIQRRVGWISPGALNYVSKRLDIPPAEAYGVASFYGLFSTTPRPPRVLHVCDDIACQTRGAEHLCKHLEGALGPAGSPGPDGKTIWLRTACLGLCERAPAALLSVAGERPWEKVIAPAEATTLIDVLRSERMEPVETTPDSFRAEISVPQAGQPSLRLLRRIGRIDPGSLDDYRAHGGYESLRVALAMGWDWVVREVVAAKLVGRGGAAFPAGRKWDPANRPRYLVCNADESEPGTFKDRIVMEGDPFALIEAMTIAGFATGCEQSYLYVRGEYPLAVERLERAIEIARKRGFLGSNILGQGLRFDIQMCKGAGAYICGEETALFNSIEGYRGEPRSKPPFPTQAGLFGKPTVINNVETLINVLEIVREGSEGFVAVGTRESAGTKLFCVSGHVVRPGVYEAPFGTTLREIIALAGGVGGSGRLQAVLLGGAAGTVVSPQELDTPLTFEGTRAIGAALGSGVVMLFDDTIDLRKILLRIAAFFRDESCGQCVPCRIGAVRQEEALARLIGGHPLGSVEEEILRLKEIGQVMRDSSICGLGQTASSAVESALRRWPLFAQPSP